MVELIQRAALREAIEQLEILGRLLEQTDFFRHVATGRFREAEATPQYMRAGMSTPIARLFAACPPAIYRLHRRLDDLRALERQHAELLVQAGDLRREIEALKAIAGELEAVLNAQRRRETPGV